MAEPPPTSARIEALRSDLAELHRKRPAATRERLLVRVSGLLLVAGPGWIAAEYFVAHSTRSGLQQRDAIIGALFGLALTVVGAVLFLRYSGGRLWRYGISRIAADQDRLTELVLTHLAPDGHGDGDGDGDDPD